MNSGDHGVGSELGSDNSDRVANDPAALLEAGIGHLRANRDLDALLCCRKALAVDPNHADSLHFMGFLSLRDNHHELAVEWTVRAIKQNPQPEYLVTLATALQGQGRYDEALRAFEKAVELRADDASLWVKLGAALEQAKRSSEALLCFQRALNFDPRNLEAAYRSAPLLHQSGRLEEALAHFNLCNELRPHHPLTLGMRSCVWRDLKRYEEYLADALDAHALAPQSLDLCINAGNALVLVDRFEDALQWLDRALARDPSSIPALENKAKALGGLHRFAEALSVCGQIKAIDPTNAKAGFNSAYYHLLLGDFEAGWSAREARWRVGGLPIHLPDGTAPVWLGGEAIRGKSVLLYSDEGLGDAIQFTRYVPMLAAQGARVTLVVQDALVPLLSGLPGLSHCLPKSAGSLPPADFRCPVMSLPLAFGTTTESIPPPVRLSAPAARRASWEARLGERTRPRVGLTWSGNPAHQDDRNRSIPLQMLLGILDAEATFVSLQKNPNPADRIVLLERTDIVDLTAHLTDFVETAALIGCLDLVITVDTSIAHLAGALGCPTWVLLPYTPDWRWQLNRDDSPWYPTVRLFRQSDKRDWREVLARVHGELLGFAAE